MGRHFPIWAFLLFSTFTVCLSRELNSKDKEFLEDAVESWEETPVPKEILGGEVMMAKGGKKYDFTFISDDGYKCSAKLTKNKDGSGGHSWKCSSGMKQPENDSTEEDDSSQLRKRKLHNRAWKPIHKRKGRGANKKNQCKEALKPKKKKMKQIGKKKSF